MKHALGSAVLSILITSLFAGPLAAQTEDPVYLIVAYMKVAPGQAEAYVNLEQELWKPVHQARVDAGLLRGWYVYRVLTPSGREAHHNYAVVNVFDSFGAMESSYPEGVWEQVHPGIDMDDVWTRTIQAREGVRGETWRAIDATQPPLATPSQYLRIDYMQVKPGDRSKYVALEQDVWKPMHQAVVDGGDKDGWALYSLVFPWGSEVGYSYATVNAFGEFADLDASRVDYRAVFAETHPDKDVAEVGPMMMSLREVVRGEVWQLVDYVQAPSE